MERLMFVSDFEVDAWSRFLRWNLIKICVWTCLFCSTLASVVSLAMFSSQAATLSINIITKSPISVLCTAYLRITNHPKFKLFDPADGLILVLGLILRLHLLRYIFSFLTWYSGTFLSATNSVWHWEFPRNVDGMEEKTPFTKVFLVQEWHTPLVVVKFRPMICKFPFPRKYYWFQQISHSDIITVVTKSQKRWKRSNVRIPENIRKDIKYHKHS